MVKSPQSDAKPGGRAVERLTRFLRDFSSGINRRELERLFEEDASRALSVFSSGSRSQNAFEEQDPAKVLEQIRNFFIGMAMELSPGRRLLFTFALLCPLLGFLDINFDFGTHGIFIDASPFWFLTSIAAFVLLLGLELVDQLRVRDELEVARQLQRDLLPQDTPLWPGWRVAHSYRTALEIGGDYYDFLPLDDGRWVVAVGDASGHGISAGLLMAITNASLKTAIELDAAPEAVLRTLNRVLERTGGRRAFMTLFYGILDLQSGELEYASAGHPFPLLRRVDGTILELGQGAFPLGLRREVQYTSQRLTLNPGDFLVLYSDGLPEAIGGDSEQSFGFERLRRLLQRPRSAQEVLDTILQAVEAHLGSGDPQDDLTLVVLDRAPLRPTTSSQRLRRSVAAIPSLPEPSLYVPPADLEGDAD